MDRARRVAPPDAWGYDEFDARKNRAHLAYEASVSNIAKVFGALTASNNLNGIREVLVYLTSQTKHPKVPEALGVDEREQVKAARDSYLTLGGHDKKKYQDKALALGRLIKAVKSGDLSEEGIECFSWLLLFLVSLPRDRAIDYSNVVREDQVYHRFLKSPRLDVRARAC